MFQAKMSICYYSETFPKNCLCKDNSNAKLKQCGELKNSDFSLIFPGYVSRYLICNTVTFLFFNTLKDGQFPTIDSIRKNYIKRLTFICQNIFHKGREQSVQCVVPLQSDNTYNIHSFYTKRVAFTHTYIKNTILQITKFLDIHGFIGWYRIVRKKAGKGLVWRAAQLTELNFR